jgi:hypothetical protein
MSANTAPDCDKEALGGAVQSPNQSFLSQIGFQFSVKKLPTTNFFVTKAMLPGLTLNHPKVGTPFATLHPAADHLQYGELGITFKVDEDMQNWMELYNWMVGIGKPRTFTQRQQLMQKNPIGEGLYSDGQLIVLSNAKNPNVYFNFENLIPSDLSPINFDTTATDVEFVECTVTFSYTMFTLTNPLGQSI